MTIITELLRNFFTHKDFLPSPEQWPGTLFSPLQIVFSILVGVFIAFSSIRCAKKTVAFQKRVFFILWFIMALSEPAISLYNVYGGKQISVDWSGVLPLWPCSIYLFAGPFAIFGKGNVKKAACGYMCTLGLLGGAVNFVYPATYLSRYSCLSMAGFYTVAYHSAIVFTAVTMLLSGYHSFKGATHWQELLLPAVPALLASVPANIVNTVVPGMDFMFFKMESFFFAPIGRATPDWLSMLLVYILYLIIHAVPYLPSYISNRKQTKVGV